MWAHGWAVFEEADEPPGPPVVATSVSVVYRGRDVGTAVRAVDLDIGPGTVTALVGSNGAGKSTLLRAVAGYLPVSAGRLRVGEASPRKHRRRWGVGFLPENPAPPPGWTVSEWIGASCWIRGMRGRRVRQETEDVLESLGLQELRGARIDRLSWGTARRVSLGFALAGSPPLVLLDEPFAGMDRTAVESMTRVLSGLSSRRATVLFSVHDAAAAPAIVDQVIAMERGRLAPTAGPPIRERPMDASPDGAR